jgi:PKD repeat protein
MLIMGIAAFAMLSTPRAALATALTGDFTFTPAAPLAGAPIGFAATSSDPEASVEWDFGDGTNATGPSAEHAYPTGGTRTVSMTLTANGETSEPITHTVVVNAPPQATFGWAPNVPQPGDSIAFDATGSTDDVGISSYAWDFGDGQTGSGATVAHVYPTGGTRTVTLTVTDSDGATTSLQRALRVNTPPTARFTFAALERVAGQPFNVPLLGGPVAFNGTGSTDADGTIATYAWDFNGDGQFTDDNRGSLITNLTTPGFVNVGLRVTDSDGGQSTYSEPIRVDQLPVASFTFAPTSPVEGQRVSFDSTSSDPDGAQDLTALRWDLDADNAFGDATGPSATRVFSTPGTHPVALQAIDSVGVQVVEVQHVAVRISGSPSASGSPFSSTFVSMPLTRSPSSGASTVLVAGVRTKLTVIPGIRVSISGRVFAGATRISRLVVAAPSGALVTARCTGRGCPAKRERHRVGSRRAIRLRKLERTLGQGARIVVSVTRRGFIGKQILFTIRGTQPPVRREQCVVPGARRAGRCPAS